LPLRTICTFSGKRGGYGAYVPLMRAVERDPNLDLLILLGDQHGSDLFGSTASEVRDDFPDGRIELIEMGAGRGDTELIRAQNLAACMAGAVDVLAREQPDVVLVHGDRAEHLVVALAALTLGLPVAHTQGGDRSGNVDEIQRHAISKLAHIHFPETDAAAERLLRLGEDSWRINVVGSTYVDRIVAGLHTSVSDARTRVGIGAEEPFLLALVHPETARDREGNRELATAVFEAIRRDGRRTIVTYPSSDPGYEGIIGVLDELSAEEQFVVQPNIDNADYLGLMASADLLVGNSSSALVEAPYFRLAAVNVGVRQSGRERDANIVDADPTLEAVAVAIARASDPSFRPSLADLQPRLGDGHAGERVVAVLRDLPIDERLLRKQLAY
jgi:GDP/UDP-N,N'-diacetylbacillosamine 2-epimerase (hydrolysing)